MIFGLILYPQVETKSIVRRGRGKAANRVQFESSENSETEAPEPVEEKPKRGRKKATETTDEDPKPKKVSQFINVVQQPLEIEKPTRL